MSILKRFSRGVLREENARLKRPAVDKGFPAIFLQGKSARELLSGSAHPLGLSVR